MYRYRSLGETYTIGTNVPLLQTFEADIPVQQMTLDAMKVVKEEAKKALPWVAAGGAAIVVVGVLIGGAFFVGRKGFR